MINHQMKNHNCSVYLNFNKLCIDRLHTKKNKSKINWKYNMHMCSSLNFEMAEVQEPFPGTVLNPIVDSMQNEFTSNEHVTDDTELLDENEFPFLKADHPALERVQVALQIQLKRELEKVQLQLREKEEEFKRVNKDREDIGVQLFGVQQQLIKLQVSLEGSYDEIEASKKRRSEGEEKLKVVQEIYEKKKSELQNSFKRMQRVNDELNQLNVTVRQVEEYNEQMKSEIQITRRGTYKAESMIQDIEKNKSKQDYLIDKMNEEIRSLSETKALYEAQLLAQKQETESALNTMAEAQREITAIEEEMQRMRIQWKKLLVDIKFREDVLSSMNDNIRKLEEQELVLDSEIRGVKSATRSAQEDGRKLSELTLRNAKESEFLELKMKQFDKEMEQLKETKAILHRSMNMTNSEAARIDQSIVALKQQRQNFDAAAQQSTASTGKLQDQVFDLLSQQKTLDKSTDNTTKSARKLHESAKKVELELLDLRNEIARVEVDALNTTAHNQILKERLDQMTSELAEKERLVDDYEVEVNKRHHEIEKRQLRVDRLNKEYDEKKRANAAGGEDAGPLEAELNNLRRELDRMHSTQGQLQSDWTARQTNLIELQQKLQLVNEKTESTNHHLIVMQQRRLRLGNDLQEKDTDVSNLANESKSVQFELDRLNPLVFELQARVEQLKKDSILEEQNADKEIRSLEAETRNIEAKLIAIKQEKDQLREDLTEAERQAMLWERRLLLEREVVEALDPGVGQLEVASMKKEIHRMELREEQLKRQKDHILLEMERVIEKKDAIELKYGVAKQSRGGPNNNNNNQKKGTTKLDLERQLKSLDASLQQCSRTAQDTEKLIMEKTNEVTNLRDKSVAENHEVSALMGDSGVSESIILQQRALRSRSIADVIRFKRAASVFASAALESYGPDMDCNAVIETELRTAERIQKAIREIYESHPHLDASLNVFLEWATTIARAIGGGDKEEFAEGGNDEIMETGYVNGGQEEQQADSANLETVNHNSE